MKAFKVLNNIVKFLIVCALYTWLSGESLTIGTLFVSSGILLVAIIVHSFRSFVVTSIEFEIPHAVKVKYNLFISLFFAPVILNIVSWGFYLINALSISWFLYDIRYSVLLLIPIIGIVKLGRYLIERDPNSVFK